MMRYLTPAFGANNGLSRGMLARWHGLFRETVSLYQALR